MTDLLTHPPAHELTAFGLGILTDDECQAISEHVAECPACQRAVAAAPGDTFTELLAEAKTVLDAPLPGDDWPAELAAHPRYTPLRLLGVGGMGTVWLAEHAVMGRRVAVKVIRPEFLARPGAANRFRREVAAAARLHHPNIVTAFDAEQAGETHFLAMEYVDGVGLDDLLKTQGALPVAEACRYAVDAAAGLDHAHRAGLVHRDVKPGNLMRAADGTVKVLDFGLAMLVADDRADASLTGANMVVGTPDYIAPEQAEHPHAADGRADIYALGCTLYHLLTGAVPFPGSSVLKKLDAHRREQPRPLSRFRADIPRGLSEIVMNMMAKDPAARFASAAAVADALRPFADGTFARQHRPRRFAASVAGFLLFAVVAAGAVVYRIQTDTGELVISTQNDDVEVIVKKGGKVVTIIDTKTQKQIELKSGEYDLELRNADGLKLDITKANLTRGANVLATIERIPATSPKVMEGSSGGPPVQTGPTGMTPGGSGAPALFESWGGPGKVAAQASHWPPAPLPGAAGFMVRLPIHYADRNGIRFSPDGRLICTSTPEYGGLELRETATGQQLARLATLSEQAWAFTPDSSRIVLVSKPTASSCLFRLWRPDTGEITNLGEPLRLMGDIRSVSIQGSPQKLVLGTAGEYLVYDTVAKAITKRVKVPETTLWKNRNFGASPRSIQMTNRIVSGDGERAYVVIGDRLPPPSPGVTPRPVNSYLDVFHLTPDDALPTRIELPGVILQLFEIPRPAGSASEAATFGVICKLATGEERILLYDALGRSTGVQLPDLKDYPVQEVAAHARRAVVLGPDGVSFESLDLTDGFRRTPVAKIANQDATALSDDGRVFGARTETGWNLYRLPDVVVPASEKPKKEAGGSTTP